MHNQYVIVATIILIVIIFMIYSGTKTFTPYSPETIFSNQSKFEGFNSLHHAQDYNVIASNQSDMYKSFLINGSKTDCKKVYGFDGLFCSPSDSDKALDIFSEAKGSPDCFGKSSGLSNSKGPLCLDKNQLDQLLNRGGNQTGMQSQIG
jgi:hypothetical protein